jgi:hypothetical protein
LDLSFESISSLNPFAEVSRRLGIRLTIRGGLVRRLVRAAIHEASELDSGDLLFCLTPFTSDIDVEHSGPPALSARVREERLHLCRPKTRIAKQPRKQNQLIMPVVRYFED